MRLLVSVRCREEALAALGGGADIIDAKEPTAGPLGAVAVEVLTEICRVVAGARPVSAALGDALDRAAIRRDAHAYAAAGAAFVKVGFAGTADPACAASLLAAALHGARTGSEGHGGIVAVAYADARSAGSLPPDALLDVAAHAGVAGVLLDTANKDGPGLRELLSAGELARWVARAHEAGLVAALAGRLQPDDLVYIRDTGADVAGVRGAACSAGRISAVSSSKVRLLRTLCDPDDLAERVDVRLRADR